MKGKNKLHRYESDAIDVTWHSGRCIHSAECTRGLPEVFDTGRKPWVDPAGAAPDRVAEVIRRCPTGALHYERKDGGPPEQPDERNVVTVGRDGPLYVRGDLEIARRDGPVVATDTRLALCRCGASGIKPYCDGEHEETGFTDAGGLTEMKGALETEPEPGRRLRVTPSPNGSLKLEGGFTLHGADGRTVHREDAYLCRCGHSGHKPFCDGTHKKVGFQSDNEPGLT